MQQAVALLIGAIWALLLGLGLFGGSIPNLPRAMTQTAGLIGLIAAFFFMPGGYLYMLLVERRSGVIRAKGPGALAIRWRWRFSFSGALAAVAGLILSLAPMQEATSLRLAGVVLFAWGLLALSVAVLAFRMKPWLADASRTR
jgi:hypothetical protein